MKKGVVGCLAFVGLAVVVIIIVAVVSIGSGSSGSSGIKSSEPDTSSQRTSAPAKGHVKKIGTSFGDGTYQVGKDIKAGTYKTKGPRSSDVLDSCYWARNKDASGDPGAIIANNNITGPGVVTVNAGEVFDVSGGCVWIKQ